MKTTHENDHFIMQCLMKLSTLPCSRLPLKPCPLYTTHEVNHNTAGGVGGAWAGKVRDDPTSPNPDHMNYVFMSMNYQIYISVTN